MRIIAGVAKGMPLAVPRNGVRPTADRNREAIFSSLGERVVGATVLDLFAGTGGLGLEAASRGAKSVLFVERSRAALSCLQKNVQTFRKNRETSCEVSVVRADVFAHLRRLADTRSSFRLILADPPYGEVAQSLLADEHLPKVLTEEGVLILESAHRDKLTVPSLWKLNRESVYGDTRVSVLARAGERPG